MKTNYLSYILLFTAATIIGCQESENTSPDSGTTAAETPESGDGADVPVESDTTDPPATEDKHAATEHSATEHSATEHAASSDNDPEDPAATDSEEHGHGRRGHGPRGMGRGPGGMGRGPGAMGGMREDMTTLHAMFADREKIRRTVRNLPNGAEAITESDDESIAGLLQEHVPAMEDRVKENKPLPPMTFHPVFVELINHADDYTLEHEATDKGIKVTYHAEDPFVIMLVQEHAKLVSRFIKNGMEEIHKPYTLPEMPEPGKAEEEATTESKSE